MTPNCPTELLESPWLKSLGFTYAKQAPLWLANQSAHHLAVGAGVEFYCENIQARPKKDKWDADGEDGIITAHCSHNGQLSIPMAPSDWDRCRMLCPVQKPKPPLAPGAQLISVSTEKDVRMPLLNSKNNFNCPNPLRSHLHEKHSSKNSVLLNILH